MKEVRVLQAMKHPCIVEFIEAFEEPGACVIVMEFAEARVASLL